MTDRGHQSIEVVRSFLKAMEPLDYDTALAFVAPSCVYINPPPIGEVMGPQGIRAVLKPFFSPTLENEFKILRESASGGIVFLERLDRHRLKDKWVELPVTGVFEVKDGLITYWRDYFDAATILTQWPTG
ncbi:limonene-1,2-epoxide hydrolase family protein [Aquidulcibacter paucihalophilus]|uniref:limonene-1,2-epoxide hydrolase family protein n=1 Tax=Aquidulcibacter paucihalophilus TaxID=1978549 RepID=UPI000A1983F2|nr:limonene-1,2-epoxide hydrolase family protein [Aquidulcibacter paucihalophilus]